ncbi:DUF456 domain-containing protein [Halopiger goleimassiliensis]|uniref:DUF456 domain-containing protein n=1 Tax=Halopiger goleimassiliensis TaxID=1293048 RepID=UPI000677B933|nr:DUF456 domain-containing protein [Halopiger goleimassiliensis]
MVEPLGIVAIALLVGGVLGTVVPLVPGGLLSLSGLFLYWWQSGYAEPGTITLAVLTGLALLALLVELFGSSIAAQAGGASWATTGVATVVAIALMTVTGPLGLLAGLFGTVFVLEYVRGRDVHGSARSALYTTVGTLASSAVQVLLTLTILLAFLVAVFV